MSSQKIANLKFSQEIKAALVIFSGIFLFLLGFNFLNGTSLFKREHTLYTVYDNVEGLQIGTKVTINGLSVGKISTIDFLNGSSKILVSFTLRNDVSFSQNSQAELYEAGLIGGKSIGILPAFDQAPRLQDGDTLKGIVKAGLTDMVNQKIAPLQEKIESVLTHADSLFININQVLNQDGQANLSSTIIELAVTVKKVNSIVTSLDGLLVKQQKNINSTIENVASISSNVNQLSDSLSQSNLKSTLVNFEQTITKLNSLLTEIEAGNGSLGKLMKEEGIYNNLEASTKEIELLVRDLKEHPKRYVHFSLFGKKEQPYQKPNEE